LCREIFLEIRIKGSRLSKDIYSPKIIGSNSFLDIIIHSRSAIYIVSIYGKSALLLTLLPELLAARSIGNTFSRRGVDCSFSTAPSTDDTCKTFADSWGIDVDDLKSLNPDLDCSKFDEETEYCISGETNNDEPTKTTTTSMAPETTTGVTTSSSTKTTKTPSTTSSVSDHKPTQPGISENCNKFHKIVDEDSCDAIEASAGITHSQFSKWNPYINNSISARPSNYWSFLFQPD